MLIKWIFNILLIIWIYTVLIRPLLQGYFGLAKRQCNSSSRSHEQAGNPRDEQSQMTLQPKKDRNDKDDGEYVDYEEVKK